MDKTINSKVIDAEMTTFISTMNDNTPELVIELDMDNYIDRYDYHDAPSSIDLRFGVTSLETFISELQELLDDMKVVAS